MYTGRDGNGAKKGGEKSACYQEMSHSWDPMCILKKHQGQLLTLDPNITTGFVRHKPWSC